MHARGWRSLCGGLLAGALLAGCASSPEGAAPGSTSRTLSVAEVDALLAGDGFGMAAAAEINGFPGPAHVLELKEELELTPDQRFATSRLVGLMRGQARALGQRIIDAEKRLDADLADGNITGAEVRARLDTIAALRAQLRYVHIDAHLEQKKILKPEQVARYYELRGRVVVREPMLPPAPAEPLALPVEAPATTPAAVAPVTTPAPRVAPALLPALPEAAAPEEATPAPVEAVPAAQAPVAAPVREPAPEAKPGMSVQHVPLPPGPETEGVVTEIEPVLESEQAAPPPEDVPPAEQTPAISPGMQDAMEDAEPAREPPAYPLTPVEENPTPPALLLETTPVDAKASEEAEPIEDLKPAQDALLSPGAQDAMEDAEPAREPPAYPLTPVEENPAPPALLLDAPVEEETTRETPAEDAPVMSPGAQDAMEDAEPAREAPAYPLTPVEENPAPPALLLDAPVEEETTQETPAEDAPVMSPGAQDAMEDAEPAREAPAYPLTPVEENPTPPALLDTSVEDETTQEAPAKVNPALSPGMQDAIEFAEPDSTADEPVHIAPLEEALPELEPTDLREPVTIDLDN